MHSDVWSKLTILHNDPPSSSQTHDTVAPGQDKQHFFIIRQVGEQKHDTKAADINAEHVAEDGFVLIGVTPAFSAFS